MIIQFQCLTSRTSISILIPHRFTAKKKWHDTIASQKKNYRSVPCLHLFAVFLCLFRCRCLETDCILIQNIAQSSTCAKLWKTRKGKTKTIMYLLWWCQRQLISCFREPKPVRAGLCQLNDEKPSLNCFYGHPLCGQLQSHKFDPVGGKQWPGLFVVVTQFPEMNPSLIGRRIFPKGREPVRAIIESKWSTFGNAK